MVSKGDFSDSASFERAVRAEQRAGLPEVEPVNPKLGKDCLRHQYGAAMNGPLNSGTAIGLCVVCEEVSADKYGLSRAERCHVDRAGIAAEQPVKVGQRDQRRGAAQLNDPPHGSKSAKSTTLRYN